MKAKLPLLTLICVTVLTACDSQPVEDMADVEAELQSVQARVAETGAHLRQARQLLAVMDHQRSTLRAEIDTAYKAMSTTRAEIMRVADDVLCAKDPTRLGFERLKPGTRSALLTIGSKTYKEVVITAFDGKVVSFSHADGVGHAEVAEYLQTPPEEEPFDLATWQPPSKADMYIKPYVPLPKEHVTIRKPAPQRPPAKKSYVLRNPINPKWPWWYRPVGWNFKGSAMSPIDRP